MGERIHYIFRDGTDTSVILYSHWGATHWETDLACALQHARNRWDDIGYGTRMMISYLIQDQVMDEHGFGIYAVSQSVYELSKLGVVIDFVEQSIVTDEMLIKFDKFVALHAPLPV